LKNFEPFVHVNKLLLFIFYRVPVSNGQSAADSSQLMSNPVFTPSSAINRGNSSPGVASDKKCLIIEELCEEEDDDCDEENLRKEDRLSSSSNGSLTAAEELTKQTKSPSIAPCGLTQLTDQLSSVRQGANRSLHSVNSLPQLVLNQISEEDEDDECHHHISNNVNASSHKYDRPSDAVQDVPVVKRPHERVDLSVAGSSFSTATICLDDEKNRMSVRQLHDTVAFEVNGVNEVDDDDDDDISVLGGHQGMRCELFRQSSMFQTSNTDCEGLAALPYTGTTNSLDRRLFQQQKKLTKSSSAASRSIVGAVKKSVSMILGHFSAVGDISSVKPSSVDTWGSCSNLSQQITRGTTKNLADRNRAAGCHFARELRQNRSEHEASSSDGNKSRSSSNVIRVRSRDFSTLVSKFASGGSA
jgi:hypothetical protein